MKPTRTEYREALAAQHQLAITANFGRGLKVVAPLEDGATIIATAEALGLRVLWPERNNVAVKFEVYGFRRRRPADQEEEARS